jgi:hypothetical protein
MMDAYTFDYLTRVCGGAFFFACLIGVACLVKYLWDEVGTWRGMSWRGLLLGGWTPGGLTWDTWKVDWQWRKE